MSKAIRLGVNIDHVATLRQARGTRYPDPTHAAFEAVAGGAHNITLHLREDRRHIQERDVLILKEQLTVPMNFEMAVDESMLAFAEKIQPEYVCLVPEKRAELTTEGGLDVIAQRQHLTEVVKRLQATNSLVSLFIDPDPHQIEAAAATGAAIVELHTGCYADAKTRTERQQELARIQAAATFAAEKGLIVDAGHGLTCQNVADIAAIPVIHTLNIGHAIVADALFCGFRQAVKNIWMIMQEARRNAYE